jgi:hypothetical protein
MFQKNNTGGSSAALNSYSKQKQIDYPRNKIRIVIEACTNSDIKLIISQWRVARFSFETSIIWKPVIFWFPNRLRIGYYFCCKEGVNTTALIKTIDWSVGSGIIFVENRIRLREVCRGITLLSTT